MVHQRYPQLPSYFDKCAHQTDIAKAGGQLLIQSVVTVPVKLDHVRTFQATGGQAFEYHTRRHQHHVLMIRDGEVYGEVYNKEIDAWGWVIAGQAGLAGYGERAGRVGNPAGC